MIIQRPNNDVIEAVKQEIGVNDKRIKEATQYLREWLQQQPHLPQEIEDVRLEQTFLRCKASTERAKRALDRYYTLRTIMPEILSNRDPTAPWFKKVVQSFFVAAMPKLTDDYCRVTILKVSGSEANKLDVYDVLKVLFMYEEVRLLEDYFAADIIIVDLKDMDVGFAAKFTLPVLKKFNMCAEEGFTTRVRSMHIINAPQVMEPFITLAKSVLKPKLASKVHVHCKGIQSLQDVIDKKVLPEEYGGLAGSMNDICDAWVKKGESYRDWYLKQENIKSDETKRTSKKVSRCELFGFEGSFRKLSLD